MRSGLRARSCLAVALCAVIAGAGAAQPEALKPAVDPDGVARIRMIAGSYFFKPNHIVVKVRTPVELTVVKEPGMAPHNFVMQAPNAGITVDRELSTDPTRITFTATATGRFPFYCTNKLLFLPSHRQQGMEGVLEVVE